MKKKKSETTSLLIFPLSVCFLRLPGKGPSLNHKTFAILINTNANYMDVLLCSTSKKGDPVTVDRYINKQVTSENQRPSVLASQSLHYHMSKLQCVKRDKKHFTKHQSALFLMSSAESGSHVKMLCNF